ncbi:MAG: DUF4159 domain-containing protein, partial [Rhodothermales bacterium]
MALVRISSAMVATAFAAVTFALSACPAEAQDLYSPKVAAVKYGGGGDWYQAQTPLPNFLSYVREHTLLDVAPQPDVVELSSDKIFSYPFLFM